jgi:hypothetical protein
LASLQDVPSVAAGFEQAPDFGSQVPATWHWSEAVHVTGVPALHEPAEQTSEPLHASPSLQLVPSASAGFVQAPLFGSQVPAAWQASLAAHAFGAPEVQTPAWQVSFAVHAFPSSHAVPFGSVTIEHIPVFGSQALATWH